MSKEIEYRELIERLHKEVDAGDYSVINKIAAAHCKWAINQNKDE